MLTLELVTVLLVELYQMLDALNGTGMLTLASTAATIGGTTMEFVRSSQLSARLMTQLMVNARAVSQATTFQTENA